MSTKCLVFTEEVRYFSISGSADIHISKATGDILAVRPFPMSVAIQKSAIIGFRQEGKQIFLLWQQSGHNQKTLLGLSEENCQDWFTKVNAIYE